MKTTPFSRYQIALTVLLLAALACEPVFVIGRGELAIVVILALVLLGPPLFRFWSRWQAFKRDQEKRGKK
jgi:hypothetical protein